MAKRGAYQRRVPKQTPGRSQQGKPAVPLTEESFETRDLPSMKDGAWSKKPSEPASAKKKSITKPNKAASKGADLPAGGNYVKDSD